MEEGAAASRVQAALEKHNKGMSWILPQQPSSNCWTVADLGVKFEIHKLLQAQSCNKMTASIIHIFSC